MWYVYVLESLSEKDFYYVGSTNNVERRLEEHNAGMSQSTKHYIPFSIAFYVAVKTESHARELEQYFKTGSGKAVWKKRFIEG
jgi:putative endonuclease